MIKSLLLENFRNHKKYSLDFAETTVLIGKNGIGKTNILEAITIISFGRSFREDDRKRLIGLESDWARVKLSCSSSNSVLSSRLQDAAATEVEESLYDKEISPPPIKTSGSRNDSREETTDYEMFMQKFPRLLTQIKQRGVAKRMSEIVGQLPCVVFSPETLNIITGDPADRRRFMDIAISQVDRGYLKNLSNYTKVRRQRNKLLERVSEGLAGEVELTFWDEQLAELGDAITAKRKESLEVISQKVNEYYKMISGEKKSEVFVEYHAKAGDNLKKKLREHRATEIAQRSTVFGPHRDELVFKIDSQEMQHYASRGETRSAILALKVAELDYIETERKKYPEIYDQSAHPLLLLDDVYSEFDADRRHHLAKLIAKYQTLITTTDREHLSPELLKSAKIVEL